MSYERADHNAHSTGTLFTFAAGAIAGAALALMFAPATGRDARAVLADRGRRAVDKGRDALDKGRDVLDRGRDVVQDQATRVRSAIERGRQQIDAVGARVERAVEDGRDTAGHTVRG
jgi:gas vesicle protein